MEEGRAAYRRGVADRVVLIRHGETDWSARGLHSGRTDVPLNADGERRAAQLRPVLAGLAGIESAHVWTSPLSRARRTCELAGLGAHAEVVDDLVEWDYGEYDGTRTVDLRAADPHWSIWSALIRAGETVEDVGQRADRVIERIGRTDGLVVHLRPRSPAANPRRPLVWLRAARRRPPHDGAGDGVVARLRARDQRDPALERTGAERACQPTGAGLA